MATNDIGRVTPIWQGFYSAQTTYELNDIVIDLSGSVWWHKSEELTTGVIPADGATWAAVIDMSVFSALIQEAIETARTALENAQAAVAEVTEDTERAESAAQNAELSALSASGSAASAGAYAQEAERAKSAAQNSESQAAASAQGAGTSASQAAASAQSAGTSASQASASAQNAGASETSAASSAQAAQTARTGAEEALAATLAAKTAALEELAEDLADAVETLEETRVSEVETAEAAIEEKGSATLATIPSDYSQLYYYSLLHVDELNDTNQIIVFAPDGSVSKVEHRAIAGNGIVREDAFTFTDTQIVETRTMSSGAKLVLTTDLATLATSVVYTAAA